jgi:hypothetical protein
MGRKRERVINFVGKLIMLALPPIIILMDLVVFILLRKAKAII